MEEGGFGEYLMARPAHPPPRAESGRPSQRCAGASEAGANCRWLSAGRGGELPPELCIGGSDESNVRIPCGRAVARIDAWVPKRCGFARRNAGVERRGDQPTAMPLRLRLAVYAIQPRRLALPRYDAGGCAAERTLDRRAVMLGRLSSV